MTELRAIGLVLFASFLGGHGAIFLKKSSAAFSISFSGIVKNKFLIAGLFLYGISVAFFVPALKGGEVSILYPMVASSYIWTSLLSMKFLNEKMNKQKWASILLIIVGIVLLTLGGA